MVGIFTFYHKGYSITGLTKIVHRYRLPYPIGEYCSVRILQSN